MFVWERSDFIGFSFVYFMVFLGVMFIDVESEGGYIIVNVEFDNEWDFDKESEDGEDEVSCEIVKMGRKDFFDLEEEVVLGVFSVLEVGGFLGLEDVLFFL